MNATGGMKMKIAPPFVLTKGCSTAQFAIA